VIGGTRSRVALKRSVGWSADSSSAHKEDYSEFSVRRDDDFASCVVCGGAAAQVEADARAAAAVAPAASGLVGLSPFLRPLQLWGSPACDAQLNLLLLGADRLSIAIAE
jgi:hypothetical protein